MPKKRTKPASAPENIRVTHQLPRDVGAELGRVGNTGTVERRVLNVGPIGATPQPFNLGVVVGERQWYIHRNGKLFAYRSPGKPRGPRYPPGDPEPLDEGMRGLWADLLAREFIDTHTSGRVLDALRPMVARYHKIVKAHVQGRIVDLAAENIERTYQDWAYSCSLDWNTRELLSGYPSIRHALIVSLALALDEDNATALVELGAFVELRLPIVQRETALLMYREACRQLAILFPAWAARGHRTPWRQQNTSVEEIFSKQFVRMSNDVDARALSLDVLLGMRQALTQVGESPLAWRYLDRSSAPADLGEQAADAEILGESRRKLDPGE